MPAEFEPQDKIWMIWPERTDNWRDGAKPAQQAYAMVAKAISAFEPVNMLVSSAPVSYTHLDPKLGDHGNGLIYIFFVFHNIPRRSHMQTDISVCMLILIVTHPRRIKHPL